MGHEVDSLSLNDKVGDYDQTAEEATDLAADLKFAEFILAAVSNSAHRKDFTINPLELDRASGSECQLLSRIDAAQNAVKQAHDRLLEQLGDDAAAQDLSAGVENGRLAGG